MRGNPPAVELDDHFTDRQPKTEPFAGGINLFKGWKFFLRNSGPIPIPLSLISTQSKLDFDGWPRKVPLSSNATGNF